MHVKKFNIPMTADAKGHTPTALPTLLELAENQLSYAGAKDRTINLKIAVGTARMMVESEKETAAERDRLRAVNSGLADALLASNSVLIMTAGLLVDGPHYAKADFLRDQVKLNGAALANAAKGGAS